jgi:hypothetical protein
MSNPQSSHANEGSDPAHGGDVPDVVQFDYPLDWKAVYRRTRERELDMRVPDEVQQALR